MPRGYEPSSCSLAGVLYMCQGVYHLAQRIRPHLCVESEEGESAHPAFLTACQLVSLLPLAGGLPHLPSRLQARMRRSNVGGASRLFRSTLQVSLPSGVVTLTYPSDRLTTNVPARSARLIAVTTVAGLALGFTSRPHVQDVLGSKGDGVAVVHGQNGRVIV